MSDRYQPVSWNRNKLIYDAVLLALVIGYVLIFLDVAPAYQTVTRPLTGTILRIQAFGTCAFLMLTMILCIGPLARLDSRFLPLLYNRRHFGVLTCAVGFVHASYVMSIYFSASPTNRYVALLSANTSYDQLLGFPFEAFGILALFLLLVLAATSHDFWLRLLTPRTWKAIHMSVYLAYSSVILHVALGYLQAAENPIFAMVAAGSVASVAGLHFAAGRGESRRDREPAQPHGASEWLDAGRLDQIAEGHGRVVVPPEGERIAIFRYDGKLSAVSNVCAHQNGPLGEGRIIDGCITCPWHGFQYRPEDGCAPPPFTEKLETFRVKIEGDRILVDPRPVGRGVAVPPAQIPEGA